MLYINDLHDTLVSRCMMFAEDTKDFREITGVTDMNMLQNDIIWRRVKKLAPTVPLWKMCCLLCL